MVAEERSNEEKLETGKNMDVEEITAGNDEYKNEEMVEKTKRNSGKIRLRNFALTGIGITHSIVFICKQVGI